MRTNALRKGVCIRAIGGASVILCVGSTKGGVGKTTLAVNFAIGLSLRGFDVLLIDGDSPQETRGQGGQ